MIRIATLNCRNAVDRWRQRRGLLLDQLVELHADVIGLQEVRHFPSQAAWIAGRLGARTAEAQWLHCTYKRGPWWLWEGIAILTHLPILERGSLRLGGDHRVASFARLRLPGGGELEVYSTHLASRGADVRAAQVRRILQWMAEHPGAAQVLVGDFNAAPTAASIRFVSRSLRSAYASVHGTEPGRTVPTPLRATAGVVKGAVLDYIFLNDRVEAHDAWVTFGRAASNDASLYASDHFGLAATVSVRRHA